MNFFEHQAQARKQSRWLILAFVLAVLAVIAAIDLVLLIALGVTAQGSGEGSPLSMGALAGNLPLLVGGALATAVVIGVASLYKSVKLSAGGGQVARDLGASLLESEPTDPLRRRLRNVVEEIALASGVPVPEIYILEQEAGINAFAAGYSPADAAIAVTQGTLEGLDRNELQGVVAHEFSHILNGDMRVNIRLMGALFGILVLALVGRKVLVHGRGIGRSRDKGGGVILLVALGLMVVGYVGQFCASWIKAAISRQREFLADASAVQFTRDPEGIGGALKKIAVYNHGSHLVVDAEEVSHMLFGDSRKMRLFSTHPPLLERIRRIEPGFNEQELEDLARKMAGENQRREAERERMNAAPAARAPGKSRAGDFAGDLIDRIGKPGWEQFALAAALAASIPGNVRSAAQSMEWAAEVLCYAILDREPEVRERQLLLVAQRLGSGSESKIRGLLDAGGMPESSWRLPLFELAFPALKRRPLDFVQMVLALVREIVRLDDRVDVFEFLLAESISQHLWESQNPPSARSAGSIDLGACLPAAQRVVGIIAWHGQAEESQREEAFAAGLRILDGATHAAMPDVADWTKDLVQDLQQLNRLNPPAKQTLVAALIAAVNHDGQAKAEELELLRICCSLIHVPLPILAGHAVKQGLDEP